MWLVWLCVFKVVVMCLVLCMCLFGEVSFMCLMFLVVLLFNSCCSCLLLFMLMMLFSCRLWLFDEKLNFVWLSGLMLCVMD